MPKLQENQMTEEKSETKTGFNLNSLGFKSCDTDRSIVCEEIK